MRAKQFLGRGGSSCSRKSCARTASTARVEWRIKRLYSIHQKLQAQKIPSTRSFDLLAIRVITRHVQDCYARLRADPLALAAGAGAH